MSASEGIISYSICMDEQCEASRNTHVVPKDVDIDIDEATDCEHDKWEVIGSVDQHANYDAPVASPQEAASLEICGGDASEDGYDSGDETELSCDVRMLLDTIADANRESDMEVARSPNEFRALLDSIVEHYDPRQESNIAGAQSPNEFRALLDTIVEQYDSRTDMHQESSAAQSPNEFRTLFDTIASQAQYTPRMGSVKTPNNNNNNNKFRCLLDSIADHQEEEPESEFRKLFDRVDRVEKREGFVSTREARQKRRNDYRVLMDGIVDGDKMETETRRRWGEGLKWVENHLGPLFVGAVLLEFVGWYRGASVL